MTTRGRQNGLDDATRSRLARLASRPVDVTALSARLREHVEAQRETAGPAELSFRLRLGWVGRGALAAGLMVAAGLLFVIAQSGSPVYAAPTEMVKLHRDLVAGRSPVIAVSGLEEARKTIEAGWREAPALPDRWDDNVHACCLRDVQSRQVACILMRQDNIPITIVLARASDLRSPEGPIVERHGRSYVVRSSDGVSMVMAQQADRWMCLMGEMPRDALVDLAEQMTIGTR